MYAARYSGPARLARLQLVAHRLASDEAFDMLTQVPVWILGNAFHFIFILKLFKTPLLLKEIMSGVNTEALRNSKLGDRVPPGWVEGIDMAARTTQDRLEAQVLRLCSSSLASFISFLFRQ